MILINDSFSLLDNSYKCLMTDDFKAKNEWTKCLKEVSLQKSIMYKMFFKSLISQN